MNSESTRRRSIATNDQNLTGSSSLECGEEGNENLFVSPNCGRCTPIKSGKPNDDQTKSSGEPTNRSKTSSPKRIRLTYKGGLGSNSAPATQTTGSPPRKITLRLNRAAKEAENKETSIEDLKQQIAAVQMKLDKLVKYDRTTNVNLQIFLNAQHSADPTAYHSKMDTEVKRLWAVATANEFPSRDTGFMAAQVHNAGYHGLNLKEARDRQACNVRNGRWVPIAERLHGCDERFVSMEEMNN